MTTATATLTDFLLARIAEDEATAESALHLTRERWWVDGPAKESGRWWVYATGEKFNNKAVADHIARHDPARVLAECEAKRAVLAAHRKQVQDDDDHAWIVASEVLLKVLAAVYSDHPDYGDSWRP